MTRHRLAAAGASVWRAAVFALAALVATASAHAQLDMSQGNNHQAGFDYEGAPSSLLQFKRAYNSRGYTSRLTGSLWLTTFDRYLLMPDATRDVWRLRRPEGGAVWFRDVGGTFVADSTKGIRLERSPDGWRALLPDGVVEHYSHDGALQRLTRGSDPEVVLTYGPDPIRPTRATESTGAFLELRYENQRLVELRDHRGRRWRYEYGPYGNLSHVAGPDGVHRTYHYEDPQNPTSMTGASIGTLYPPRPEDRGITWAYDAQNRATLSVLKGGLNRTEIVYHGDTLRVATDPTGVKEYHTVRLPGGRLAVQRKVRVHPDGRRRIELERTYDAAGQVVRTERGGKVETQASVNVAGKPATRTLHVGTRDETRVEYRYDTRFPDKVVHLVSKHAHSGSTTTVEVGYDDSGHTTEFVVTRERQGYPLERAAWSARYDGPHGRVSEVDGPRDGPVDVARYEYAGSAGLLARIVASDGTVLTRDIVYDEHGRIVAARRGEERIEFAYELHDDRMREIKLDPPGKAWSRMRWTHAPRQRVLAVELEDESGTRRRLEFERDPANRIVESRLAGEATLVFEHAGDPTVAQSRIVSDPASVGPQLAFLRDAEAFLRAAGGHVCPCLDIDSALELDAVDRAISDRLESVARYGTRARALGVR